MRKYQGTAGSVFAAFARIARRDAALAAGVVAFWAAEAAPADEIPAYGVSVVDPVVVEWSYNLDLQLGYLNVRAVPGTSTGLESVAFETPGAPIDFLWNPWPRYSTHVMSAVGPGRIGIEHTAQDVQLATGAHAHRDFRALISTSAVPVELVWSTYRVKPYGEPEFGIPFVTVQSIIPEPSALALLAAGALAGAAWRRDEQRTVSPRLSAAPDRPDERSP